MKYGFIGCGNMGGALARALAENTRDFLITDRSGKAKALAQELGCVYSDAETIVSTCDAVFLGVKPHMMAGVLEPLRPILGEKKPTLISMAAGLEISKIEAFAGGDIPVIRIMPNTPVGIGKGIILYCTNSLVDPAAVEQFKSDLSHAGRVDALEERLMDVGSALSGSGPAYAYMFIDALADGAVACGVPRAKAIEYAAATLAGAAEMVLATGQHPGALKDAVCSPGGSTMAGVRALESGNFRSTVTECICATYDKNKELGK